MSAATVLLGGWGACSLTRSKQQSFTRQRFGCLILTQGATDILRCCCGNLLMSGTFQPIRRQPRHTSKEVRGTHDGDNERHIDDVDEGCPSRIKDQCRATPDHVLESVTLDDMVESGTENVAMTELHEPSEVIDDTAEAEKPSQFPQLSASEEMKRLATKDFVQVRRVMVPPHRMSPLKKQWLEIVEPIVKHMKLLIRMNLKHRCVELKMTSKTAEVAYLQKAADFVKSFMLGFDVQDGIALLRLNDLFLESFEIKDVKTLTGDNLSRCIGRISGKEGKTKHAIENATRTRIVLADSHIHILGAYQNIKAARDSICSLILGTPTGKVYNKLRSVSRRLQERQ